MTLNLLLFGTKIQAANLHAILQTELRPTLEKMMGVDGQDYEMSLVRSKNFVESAISKRNPDKVIYTGAIRQPGTHGMQTDYDVEEAYQLVRSSFAGPIVHLGIEDKIDSRVITNLPIPKGKSIVDKLIQLGIPDDKLDHVMQTMDAWGTSDINLTTTSTYTDLVVDFQTALPNRVGEPEAFEVYAKLGQDTRMLQREEAYMNFAWQIPILQPIITKPVSYHEEDGIGMLITYSADQHSRVVPQSSAELYHRTKEDVQRNLSGMPLSAVAFTEIFNMALEHTYMLPFMNEEAFDGHLMESIADRGKIEMWLQTPDINQDHVRRLAPLLGNYSTIAERAQHYDAEASALVNYDSGETNIFGKDSNTRVRGDFGLVTRGTPEFALASLRATKDEVDVYCAVRQQLERSQGRDWDVDSNELFRKSQEVMYLKDMRMAGHRTMLGASSAGSYVLAAEQSHRQLAVNGLL